jgi:hypothetical protein
MSEYFKWLRERNVYLNKIKIATIPGYGNTILSVDSIKASGANITI